MRGSLRLSGPEWPTESRQQWKSMRGEWKREWRPPKTEWAGMTDWVQAVEIKVEKWKVEISQEAARDRVGRNNRRGLGCGWLWKWCGRGKQVEAAKGRAGRNDRLSPGSGRKCMSMQKKGGGKAVKGLQMDRQRGKGWMKGVEGRTNGTRYSWMNKWVKAVISSHPWRDPCHLPRWAQRILLSAPFGPCYLWGSYLFVPAISA